MSYAEWYDDLPDEIKAATRVPTGTPAWPLTLVEGEEKAGKSYQLARLSADPRIGMTFAFDWEGRLDEYRSLGDYVLVDWNGTFLDFEAKLKAVAQVPRLPDGRPNLIIIDPITALWRLLVDWADRRARNGKKNRDLLEKDPDAEIVISMNLWNDAKDRWRRVMDVLTSYDGLVVLAARGGEVAVLDAQGNPVANQRSWSVQAEKTLTSDVTAWVRVHRSPRRAELVGAASLNFTVENEAMALPLEDTLAHVIFDLFGAGQADFGARQGTAPTVGFTAAQAKTRLLEAVGRVNDSLNEGERKAEAARIWEAAGLKGIHEITPDQLAEALTLVEAPPAQDGQEPDDGDEDTGPGLDGPEEPQDGPQGDEETEPAPDAQPDDEEPQEEPETADDDPPAASPGPEDVAPFVAEVAQERADRIEAYVKANNADALRRLCRGAGLGDEGNKGQMAARLVDLEIQQEIEEAERREAEEAERAADAGGPAPADPVEYGPGEEPF